LLAPDFFFFVSIPLTFDLRYSSYRSQASFLTQVFNLRIRIYTSSTQETLTFNVPEMAMLSNKETESEPGTILFHSVSIYNLDL
jgi:hypothetical protein